MKFPGRNLRRSLTTLSITLLSTALILGCSSKDPLVMSRRIVIEGKSRPVTIKKRVINPLFFITKEELHATLSELPETSATAIMNDADRFLTRIAQMMKAPQELTWLVDKQHTIPDAPQYRPEQLVALGDYPDLHAGRAGMQVSSLIINDLQNLSRAAEAEGLSLLISSAYRSYDYQKGLFERWVRELGYEEAARVSAVAGTSQHQLGTTVDFGSITKAFADTPEGIWILANAYRFGFSLSYPEGLEELTGYDWEPWHYRYIGQVAAGIEQDYFDGIQQQFLSWWNLHRNWFEAGMISPERTVEG